MTPGALPPPFAGFSAEEMARRRGALEGAMAAEGLDSVVLYGANRSGSAVSWLTGWPVTREAHALVTRGEPDVLLVSFYNHVPEARRRAAAADVRFAGDDPAATLVELLAAHGAARCPGTSTPRSPRAAGWSTSPGPTPGCARGSRTRRSRLSGTRPRSPMPQPPRWSAARWWAAPSTS